MLGPELFQSARAFVKAAWRETGLHRWAVWLFLTLLIWFGSGYWHFLGAYVPWYVRWGSAGGFLVLALIPPMALAWRDMNRKDYPPGFLWQSDKLHNEWTIGRILQAAKPLRWTSLVPDVAVVKRVKAVSEARPITDVLVICKGGSSWEGGAFNLNHAPNTATYLRTNSKVSLGVLFCKASSDPQRAAVALSDDPETWRGLESAADATLEKVFGFWKAYPDLKSRVEVRLLMAGVFDSMCVYDPGYPGNPVINFDINRGYIQQPYPIIRVENIGDQRKLYAALFTRAYNLWNLGRRVVDRAEEREGKTGVQTGDDREGVEK